MYKITKANEAVPYEAAKHFKVLTTRLHNPTDVEKGTLSIGLSHFLPGGGSEYAPSNCEMIYHIVTGEMKLTIGTETEKNETVLYAGDSVHMTAGTYRCVLNETKGVSQMLVIINTANK